MNPEKIIVAEKLNSLIAEGDFECAKDFIYKNFKSENKPFRNIEFLKDQLPPKYANSSTIEIGIDKVTNWVWLTILSALTIIHFAIWVDNGFHNFPILLALWVIGMLFFVWALSDKKCKVKIDDRHLTIEHLQVAKIDITKILTGYAHHWRTVNYSSYSYLTLFFKNGDEPKQFNISDLELNGFEIGALINKFINQKKVDKP